MTTKTFVPRFIVLVKVLCKYFTRYQGKILTNLEGLLSPTDFATVSAAMATIVAACAILDAIYPWD